MPNVKQTKEFAEAYAKLNPEQRTAVDTLEGPVMVVAGPGTGKTQTIALRIANILAKTDTDPDAILALTFTESGAKAMRQRLLEFIGHTAYYVNVSTFHGFCVDVIRENPDHFTVDPNAEPLSDLERLKLMYRLLDESKARKLRPVNAPYHYARAISGALQDLKREGVSPEEFDKVLAKEKAFLDSPAAGELKRAEALSRTRNLGKNLELAALYHRYQSLLTESKRFDFEDMINLVVGVFRSDPELLRAYQERFQYFLVDEFQDTNNSQNEVLNLLASFWGEEANVFVVGDPDQSIFRFQGASVENMLTFVSTYPSAVVVTLRQNYRSTQVILDAAHSLISHNNLRINDVVAGLDPHLLSNVPDGVKLTDTVASTSLSETVFLAETIQSLIKKGTPPSEIAVIYRNNADAELLQDVFSRYGIDYVIQGGANVLEDPTVRQFLKILRVIYEMRAREDDLDLFTILHYDIFHVAPLDVLKISRLAADKKTSLFEIIANPSLLDGLELTSREQIDKVLSQLGSWEAIDANLTFTAFFEVVLNESGFLNWVLGSPDAHHKISRLNTLFAEVKRMNAADHSLDLRKFLENLDLMEANNLRLEDLSFASRDGAVTLTTAHSAKGLEWDTVFVYKSVDKTWGNNRSFNLISLPASLLTNTDLSEKEKNEDERRLYYVAITRAKTHLFLTHPAAVLSAGRSREVLPSMFISELGDASLSAVKVAPSEVAEAAHLETLLRAQAPAGSEAEEAAYLKGLVDKFALSVTALNTYLSCPYLFKLNNLLKVPRAKASYLSFGTAVHTALELFFRRLAGDGKRPQKQVLLDYFDAALKREILRPEDEAVRIEQGHTILSAYYDFYLDDMRPPVFLEKYSRVKLDDITLTGKIDRMDWYDESDRTVRVVDYKTGKIKTKGQIMGETADSAGDLHRQLVFYKLLIDLDRRLRVHFGQAELDFVQAPADQGKDGKIRFQVSAEEVTALKKVIYDVMKEIRALHFPRTTDYGICVTCPFKDHCWPQGIPNH